MNAIELTKQLMSETHITYQQLADATELGTPSNLYQMLSRKDLKVSTFVKILEAMDCQLVVQSMNTDDDYVIDNEEV
jgi:predicted transcriptional regulator